MVAVAPRCGTSLGCHGETPGGVGEGPLPHPWGSGGHTCARLVKPILHWDTLSGARFPTQHRVDVLMRVLCLPSRSTGQRRRPPLLPRPLLETPP